VQNKRVKSKSTGASRKTKPVRDATGQTVADAALASSEELLEALRKSVELQAHYAMLLNMHDGGSRIGKSLAMIRYARSFAVA
jgi:hypothetical protein